MKAETHEVEQGSSEDDAKLPAETAREEEIQEEDRLLLRRQEGFRAGADERVGLWATLRLRPRSRLSSAALPSVTSDRYGVPSQSNPGRFWNRFFAMAVIASVPRTFTSVGCFA